jgi:hypothetical protein
VAGKRMKLPMFRSEINIPVITKKTTSFLGVIINPVSKSENSNTVHINEYTRNSSTVIHLALTSGEKGSENRKE